MTNLLRLLGIDRYEWEMTDSETGFLQARRAISFGIWEPGCSMLYSNVLFPTSMDLTSSLISVRSGT